MIIKTEPRFTQDWFSNNIPNWSKFLGYLKLKKDKRFLEIGCFEGRATRWLLTTLMEETDIIEVIDTFTGSPEHEKMNVDVKGMFSRFLNNIGNSPSVIIHQGFSQEILKEKFNKKKEIFDFIYIDADHQSTNVIQDVILSWPLLKRGGTLIFDDYEWIPSAQHNLFSPAPAIDVFLYLWQKEIEVVFKGYQVILKKI